MIRFRTRLPNRLELSNDFVIEVYNKSTWIDTLLGSLTINPSKIKIAPTNEEKLPDPKWYNLYSVNKDKEKEIRGSLLMSFMLLKIRNVQKRIPKPELLIPVTKKCWVYVLLIGTRKIAPFRILNVTKPYVELRISNSKPIKSKIGTQNNHEKSDVNHNFLEIIKFEVELPVDPIYCPSLDIIVMEDYSSILGGNTVVGAASTNLVKFYY